jgi:hypothetical protein
LLVPGCRVLVNDFRARIFNIGRFRLENNLKMLISALERFRQEINADQRQGCFFQLVLDRTKPKPISSFWRRKLKYPCQSVFPENEPHKSFIFQNKLIPWFLSKVWNEKEHFRLVFAKMLVFMPKTGFLNASTGVGCRSTFSIVGAQLCLPYNVGTSQARRKTSY